MCGCVFERVQVGTCVAQQVDLNVNEYFDSFCLCVHVCVYGSTRSTNIFHSFPSINNNVSATDILMVLSENEKMGVKKLDVRF